MDKREYQEKLQEINQLIAAEDYEGAAKVADSIDWKRVRNVQTLVMISEVYEAVERYEDSKILLLRAYRRSPVGRTVLYRLVECCIKLRQFDQAIEYYSEYVQAAPHDNNKFILKYKIYRGRGASLEEQIDILKEYLDQEYNEKWAYELARLEIQAGRVQEGLATCDDLVLWFHSGKYVIKALELKKKYAPLTPKQQEIYDHRFEHEEEPEIVPESYLSEAASLAKAERAAAAQDEIKSELAADISQTARVEATKIELKRKAEQAEAEIDRKAAASRRALAEPQAEAPVPEDAAKHAAAPHAASAPVTGAAAEAVTGTAVPETEKAEEPMLASAPTAAVVTGAAAAEAVSEAAAPEAVSEAAVPETAGAEEPISPAASAAAVVTGTVAAETEKEEESMSTAAAGEAKTLPAESRAASAPPSDEAFAEAAREAVSELAEGKIPADAAGTESETVPEEIRQEAPADAASEIEPSAGASAQEELSSEASEEEPAGAEEKWSAGAAVAATLAGAAVAATIAGAASEEASAGSASEREETGMPEREKLQEDMVRNMREIVSGVGPKAQISEEEAILENAIDQSKEDQEMAVAARGSDMTFRVPESEASQKRQAGRLTIDDILLSMGDRGEHVRKVTGGSVMSASEESQMSDQPEIPRFLRDDVHEARQTAEIPAAVIAGADDAFRTERGIAGREETDGYGSPSDGAWTGADAARGNAVQETGTAQTPADGAGWDGSAGSSVRKASPAEETMDPLQDPEAAAAAAAFMSTQRVPYTREIAEAKTRRLPVEEIRKLHEAYLSESAAAAEEASKNVSQTAERAAEMAEAEAAMMNGLPDRAGFTDTPADKAAGPGGPAFRDRMPKEAAGRSASVDEPAGRPAVPDEPAEKPAKKPSRWSLFSRKPSGKAAKTNEPSGRAAAPNVPSGRTALPEDDDIRIAGAPGSNSGAAGIAAAGLASSGTAATAAGADAPSDKPQNDAGKGGAAAGIAAAAGLAAVGVAAAAADTDESSEKPQREEAKGGAAAGIAAAGLAAAGVAAAVADQGAPADRQQGDGMQGGYGAGNAPAAGAPAFDMAGAPADRQQREEMGYGAVRRGPIGEQVMREVPKSEPEPQLFTGRPQLKAGQMELFRGFTSIGNLSEQIAGAIWQAENRKDNRTSRTGNILILGAHGCGKTTIATGIAKAIAEDKGSHSVKMARIYAADLNRKDIAATIAKIAGGVLIVEEAGDLDDAIVDQLTTAMEFRTDGLIIILEDEQRYIHELLMRHPRFTMKFTAQIYIPEYTEDDLTGFGMIYAESKDYVFSEGAVEACRARIEAARKNGEPVSVTNVIELVDRAIKGADSFFRRLGSAKKRYDEQDRIILREKDFR